MANYSPPIGPRMAYDLDGTAVFLKNTGTSSSPSAVSGTNVAIINGEAFQSAYTFSGGTDTSSGAPAWLAFIFPQARDLVGYFAGFCGSAAGAPSTQSTISSLTPEYSTNSTNGLDGTWSAWGSAYVPPTVQLPYYRTAQVSASAVGATGVRFRVVHVTNGNVYPQGIHLFGSFSTPTFQRLAIWHPTLNQELTYVDFGDIARNASSTVQFRVKNLSSLTANGVQVASSVLSEASPTVSGQIQYSSDNSTYSSILSLGTLSSGSISSVLYVKNTVASNAAVALWTGRIRATATSFS